MAKTRDLYSALEIVFRQEPTSGITITNDKMIIYGGPQIHTADGYRLTELGWSYNPDTWEWSWWDTA